MVVPPRQALLGGQHGQAGTGRLTLAVSAALIIKTFAAHQAMLQPVARRLSLNKPCNPAAPVCRWAASRPVAAVQCVMVCIDSSSACLRQVYKSWVLTSQVISFGPCLAIAECTCGHQWQQRWRSQP